VSTTEITISLPPKNYLFKLLRNSILGMTNVAEKILSPGRNS